MGNLDSPGENSQRTSAGSLGHLGPHDGQFWIGFVVVCAACLPVLIAPLIFIGLSSALKYYHFIIGGAAGIFLLASVWWRYRKSRNFPEEWRALGGFRRGIKAAQAGLNGFFLDSDRTGLEASTPAESNNPAKTVRAIVTLLLLVGAIGGSLWWLWWLGYVRL